jgi:PAS domain S-box-containing protein
MIFFIARITILIARTFINLLVATPAPRKDFGAERKGSEFLLENVSNLPRIGTWEMDVNAGMLYWSDVTRDIHEVDRTFKPPLTVGIDFCENEEDKMFISAQVNRAVNEGLPFDIEIPIVTAKSNRKRVRVIGQPEQTDGKYTKIYGSIQDIDSVVKDEQHVPAQSARYYSEFFQYMHLPSWIFDLETLDFLDVNHAAIEQYGYTRSEFLSMTIRDLRDVDETASLLAALEQRKARQQFAVAGVFNHKKKNGDLIYTEIRGNDVEFNGREARIVIATDITERTNHINAIEMQNEQLKQISWIQSHTIRAPLTNIIGLVQCLDDIDLEDIEDLQKIKELLGISTAKLDNVIRSIIDKSSTVNYKK